MFFIAFEFQKIVHISATGCSIEMWFASKCGILNGQVIKKKKKY